MNTAPYFRGLNISGAAANYSPVRSLGEIAEEFNLRFEGDINVSSSLQELRTAVQMADPDGDCPDWIGTRTHAWAALESWLFRSRGEV